MNKKNMRIRINKKKKKLDPSSYYLYGFHAVYEAISNKKRKKLELWLTKNAYNKLISQTTLPRIPIHFIEKTSKLPIPKENVHQGAILKVSPLNHQLDKELLSREGRNIVIVLDKVTDPQNVGAIIRTSLFFGCVAVINSERGGAGEGGALVKGASGAFEKIPYILTTNISQTLIYLKKSGFVVIGLEATANLSINSNFFSDFENNLVLVFGSEGKGLRRLTLENCDYLAKITGYSDFYSLNVSTAVGITLNSVLNS